MTFAEQLRAERTPMDFYSFTAIDRQRAPNGLLVRDGSLHPSLLIYGYSKQSTGKASAPLTKVVRKRK